MQVPISKLSIRLYLKTYNLYIFSIYPVFATIIFISQIGIPALGFSPINNTPNLLHNDNEFLNEETFLRGLDIYYNIIRSLASI